MATLKGSPRQSPPNTDTRTRLDRGAKRRRLKTEPARTPAARGDGTPRADDRAEKNPPPHHHPQRRPPRNGPHRQSPPNTDTRTRLDRGAKRRRLKTEPARTARQAIRSHQQARRGTA